MKLDETNIKNLKDGLNRKVQYCMNMPDKDPELVVGIHDYIEYINIQPILDNLITDKIQDSARKKINKLKTLEKRIIKELDLVFEEIQRKTTSEEKEEIKDWMGEESSFKTYLKYKDGTISSSRGRIHELHNTIRDILNNILKIRGKNDFSDYMKIEERNNLQYFHYFLSKDYADYSKTEKSLQNEKEVSAWGSFDELYICYQAIEGYIGNQSSTVDLQNQREFYASAFISLKENKTTFQYNPVIANNKKNHLQRLNLKLLDELDLFEANKETEQVKSLKKTNQLEPVEISNERNFFELKDKKLINKTKDKESERDISGEALELLKLFLKNKSYRIKREVVLNKFKSKDAVQHAMSELSSRILDIAFIHAEREQKNKKYVDYYELRSK